MDVYIKVYETAGDVLIAVCDEDILGKTFSFGDIDFEVKESFYRGNREKLEDIKSTLERATVLNLVGTAVVEKCIEWGYIEKDKVLRVGDTVHAQMVKV